MSRVLVDSSVWVEMLRGRNSPEVSRLGVLLRENQVCTNGLIRAEVLSGAKTPKAYRQLSDDFSALELLPDPPELWEDVSLARFSLARKGFHAGIADLVVAVSAARHRRAVFSLDQAFERIREAVPMELLPPPRLS